MIKLNNMDARQARIQSKINDLSKDEKLLIKIRDNIKAEVKRGGSFRTTMFLNSDEKMTHAIKEKLIFDGYKVTCHDYKRTSDEIVIEW